MTPRRDNLYDNDGLLFFVAVREGHAQDFYCLLVALHFKIPNNCE